jgi:hypothetical protein
MSTKRTVTVAEAVGHLLKLRAPAARIERLREHEAQLSKDKKLARWRDAAWKPKADELARWYEESGQPAPAALIAAITEAEKAVAAPYVKRDDERQEGVRKRRGSRTPKLDAWLDAQDLSMKKDELWEKLPEDSLKPVYRDDDCAYEAGRVYPRERDGKERGEQRPITRKDFDARVTEAKKRQKPS